MLVFIDESGIHKQVGHSSIVLVYVIFKDAEKVERRILEIEKQLKIKSFHWSEQRWEIKGKFLSMVAKLPFKIKVAILRNPINLLQETENVLQYLITDLITPKVRTRSSTNYLRKK